MPIQFSVSEQTGEGGRRGGYRDVKMTRGRSKKKERREECKTQIGERGMRGGDRSRSWQKEKREGERQTVLHPYLQIPAHSLHHFYSFGHFKAECAYACTICGIEAFSFVQH